MPQADPPADGADRPTVRRLLTAATSRLRDALTDAPKGSADTPYLDALVLLATAMGEPIERVLAELPDPVGDSTAGRFGELVRRRAEGEPVSYIRGVKEFYGREFGVSPAVLVPRPDTETLIEDALETIDSFLGRRTERTTLHAHDAFTGSGCVAVTLAAERPSIRVSASDVDPAALDLARVNADRLVGAGVIDLFTGDVLDAVIERVRDGRLPSPGIVTANPPYLTDGEYASMRERGWPEPPHALEAGPDGLRYYRRLAEGAVTLLPSGGYLIVEIGHEQADAVSDILTSAGFSSIDVRRDLSGRERVVRGRFR